MNKWNADIFLNQTKNMGKIPGHVSLMFLEEDTPVEDIVKPIVWCICLGEESLKFNYLLFVNLEPLF